MTREFRATFVHRGDWWIGWADDVPGTNAQERTLAEARESLKQAVADLLAFHAEESAASIESHPEETVRETLTIGAA